MPRKRLYESGREKQSAYRLRKSLSNGNALALQNELLNIKVKRSPLRWLGGKWRLGTWVASHFPPHITYCEPFAGGAGVLLQKEPSAIEVINDLNGDVVNFFHVLRTSPDELIRAIQLTPYSREVYECAFEPADDPLERALALYIRCWQGFQPGSGGFDSGWRAQKTNNRDKSLIDDWCETAHLWDVARRLKRVQIEHNNAVAVIGRFDTPNTLFYVDPPYVLSTRSSSNTVLYKHEMTDGDHRDLATSLQRISGMAIISGYASALYDELYAGWQSVTKATNTNTGQNAIEKLWFSPNAIDNARLPLFEGLIDATS